MIGRDAPKRGPAGAFRRRVPRDIPKQLDPILIEQLIATARSWRDKAILTLLYRTGQRIGDWSAFAGRHGVLGMTLADIDERARTVTVRLRGPRDEHVVPITDDFWPLFQQYLTHERPTDPSLQAAWVGLRKGHGKPLSYAAFESSLRSIRRDDPHRAGCRGRPTAAHTSIRSGYGGPWRTGEHGHRSSTFIRRYGLLAAAQPGGLGQPRSRRARPAALPAPALPR